MNIEEAKAKGLYDLPQALDNEQSKKYMAYNKFVEEFLKEDPRELNSFTEKKALFLLLWATMYDKRMETDLNYMKEMSVLDIRAKSGQMVEMLTGNGHCKTAVGVDMVKPWVEYANKKGRNVIYREDPTQLPFSDGAFDIVYSYKTFGRVPDNKAFLKELIRVSKKYVFLLIDDIAKDRNMQYTSTLDLRVYKKWAIEFGGVELTLANNPVSNRQDEKLMAIYNKGCGGTE